MSGFFIQNMLDQNSRINDFYKAKCVAREIFADNYQIMRNSLNKFGDDKLFYQDSSYVIIVDVVTLNKIILEEKYATHGW